jgi:predicted thioesterase
MGVKMNRLKPGATGQFTITVKNEHLASSMGNTGVDVLATPMVAMMFEAAATDALKSVMRADEISVGTWISVYHLKPTPPGMSITARVTLIESKGVRYLFDVEVHDDVEKVAEGSIERAIINKDRFYRTLNEKVEGGSKSDITNCGLRIAD